uniref:Single domain-containing protein n=1 Tax=Amblyomma maculatum TaxID=34609 RepID=G3MQB7_AMBMU
MFVSQQVRGQPRTGSSGAQPPVSGSVEGSWYWTNTMLIIHALLLPAAQLVNCIDNSDLDTFEVLNVPIKDGQCQYRAQSFSSVFQTNETVCEDWYCSKKEKKVSVLRCSPLPPGCERKPNANAKFPDCCEKSCLKKTTPPCQTPDGTPLLEGGEYNSTKPCVRYECTNGRLITQQCPDPEPTDPQCSRSFAVDAPYPACCGAGIVCPDKGKGKGKIKAKAKALRISGKSDCLRKVSRAHVANIAL